MAAVTLDVSVVMVPLPAQGHLNQFFHLSRLLAARGLSVHYVSSTVHNRQLRDRAGVSSLPDASAAFSVEFHDIPLPPFASPPPDLHGPNAFPSHLQPAFDAALQYLRSPLSDIVQTLAASSRRVVVIHDSPMAFAASAAASLPNVESFCFHSISAIAAFFYQWVLLGKPYNPAIEELNLPDIPIESSVTEEFLNFVSRQKVAQEVEDSGQLLNTCRAIEGKFIDLLARDPEYLQPRTFAIGPLNSSVVLDDRLIGGKRHGCLEWLDEQPLGSVVYVSFGTTCTLKDEQVEELAAGLEESGQPFIWVLREADKADIYAQGKDDQHQRFLSTADYLERTGRSRGMVVRGWAPQMEILGHRSTGCFMSHCGWNSCMESISAGVAMLAWPMHSDQPVNAFLVARLLGSGVVVREWEERDGVVSRGEVRDSIRRVMMEEGRAVRERAKELGDEVRRAVMDGGTSKKDLDDFIAYVSRADHTS